MEAISSVAQTPLSRDVYKYPVLLDGRLVGYFSEDTVDKSAAYLRTLKIKGEEVPITTEIVVVPKKQVSFLFHITIIWHKKLHTM